MTGHVLRLLRIGLNVADLRRAKAYYRDLLGFAIMVEEEIDPHWVRLLAGEECRARTARCRLGRQELELVEFDPPGAEYPSDSTAADLWFQHFAIVTNDMVDAYRRLTRDGVVPISQNGPQRLPASAGAVTAYKFRDLDGHPLELIHFPEGIGDPAWQCGSVGSAIGIDHSALSVSDVGRSVVFYTRLGLVESSRQVNAGSEQDQLDGLSNVSVAVIGMAPAAERSPHVELLCYHTPRGRRSKPRRAARDLASSRLIFQVQDLAGLIAALKTLGFLASSVVELGSGARAALVRDPDGHVIVLETEIRDHSASSTQSSNTRAPTS
jgi:catechol 2,3-dioxygenase-like lactoylglutathione lyase family enzyme